MKAKRSRTNKTKRKGITQVEFAKLDGCSQQAVYQAISSGALETYEDGSLDPALVGTGWRATNRKKIEKANEPQGESNITGLEIDGGLMKLAQAEQVQKTYDALKRKRLHDQEIGTVVLVDDTVKAVAEAYAVVRTKLLAIPSEHAPRLHLLKTVPEVQDYLLKIITRALEELADG